MGRSGSQRGVTLVEALIALVVVALGLLSFAVLQARMRLNADIARQRSEAVRIAQENMENFRAFGSLAVNGSMANNFAYAGVSTGASAKTVLASSVSTTTNTTYTVTQTVSASTQAGMKEVLVTVSWTDRDDQSQSVALRSFIAGIDPKLAAALAIPPNGSPIKDPLGRDLRVPIPAKDLGNGTSAFKPDTAGGVAFVFNNDTGAVVEKCTGSTVNTAQLTTGNLGTCVTVDGLILAGYVRFDTSNNPSAETQNGVTMPLSIRMDLSDTAPSEGTAGAAALLDVASWPTLATAPLTTGYTPPDCGTQDSKTVTYTAAVSWSIDNNGVTQTTTSAVRTAIVPVGMALTAAALAPYVTDAEANISNVLDTSERYIAYTCIVYPINFSGRKAWTGRTTVVPSGWTIGTTSSDYKVCRFSADYNLNGYVWQTSGSDVTKIDNPEHPYAYLQVGIGLNNQNFLVIKGNRSCPTSGGVEVDGTGQDTYTDTTTVIHQQVP